MVKPELLTFDVFGTLIDWRRGLGEDLARLGLDLSDERFEHVLADQEHAEDGPFQTYAEIVTWSLVRRLGLTRQQATQIGRTLGMWPWFADARPALERLMALAPCIALTNSDRIHGEQAQSKLGFRLNDWLCAEETHVYKPQPAFWQALATRRQIQPGPSWWHVSAYADYDLATARQLGLTTVFVQRPHSRPGPADLTVADLNDLVQRATG